MYVDTHHIRQTQDGRHVCTCWGGATSRLVMSPVVRPCLLEGQHPFVVAGSPLYLLWDRVTVGAENPFDVDGE